jgi:hypothetical protein
VLLGGVANRQTSQIALLNRVMEASQGWLDAGARGDDAKTLKRLVRITSWSKISQPPSTLPENQMSEARLPVAGISHR